MAGVATSERTGTAAVGDSGNASMSVASTGLVERGGLPGLDSAVLGGVMLWATESRVGRRREYCRCLGSKAVARARPTIRISDADPLVHSQTFAAFITCCSQFCLSNHVIISMRERVSPSRRSYSDQR